MAADWPSELHCPYYDDGSRRVHSSRDGSELPLPRSVHVRIYEPFFEVQQPGMCETAPPEIKDGKRR
eukprot:354352-Chlamydomonas_euryale.AAC.1